MISFDRENREIAREWILKLFKDKKYYHSAIYKENEFMQDAIIKYEDDPYAFPELEEDQFDEVFSAFEDDKILVVHNFPCYLKREHFLENYEYIFDSFRERCPIVFTISKELFDYKIYLGIISQFHWIAFIDQKSGRTMIALSELNFLIYP